MTNITFYGGVNEIGGNKILLEDKGTKIFIDFGRSFGLGDKFFEHFLVIQKIQNYFLIHKSEHNN